jgi:glycosyltransferase involved in cell wall biosynthesis
MKTNGTLVIIIPGFPDSEADTTCLPMQQSLIKAFNKLYPHLKIMIIAYQYPHFKKEYTWRGNKVISMNAQKGIFKKIFIWRRLWNILRGVDKNDKITGILNIWLGEYAVVAKRFGKKKNIPSYTWLMGQDARSGNKFVSLLNPEPEEVIALSDFLADEFEKNYSVRPNHIIPSGIDTSHFSQQDFPRNIDVLGVGSLIPLKQYDLFIDVIRILKQKIPDIKCMIIGKGEKYEHLSNKIKDLQLERNITLAGELPYPATLQHMQRARIFLHPSSYEGFGTVCIEALYAGAYVISYCKPMRQEIENWYIAGTYANMVNHSLELLNNQSLGHKSVSFMPIEKTAQSILKLFGY